MSDLIRKIDLTNGGTITGDLTFSGRENGIIWADGTVSTTAVSSISALAGVVQTSKIDTDAVTAISVLAGSIQTSKLGTDAVQSAAISAGAVETAKLGTDSVTSTAIRPGSVETSRLVDGVVTAQKVADSAIQTAKLGNDSVTAAKLIASDSSLAKITSGQLRFDTVNNVLSSWTSTPSGQHIVCLGSNICNGDWTNAIGVSNNCKGRSSCIGFNNSGGAVGGDYYAFSAGASNNCSGFTSSCLGTNNTNAATSGSAIGENINLSGSFNHGIGYNLSIPSGSGGLGTLEYSLVGGRRARGRNTSSFTWNLTANDVYKESYGAYWYTLHADAGGGLAIEVGNSTTTITSNSAVFPGSATASSFWGDGAHLTGIVAGGLATGSVETAKLGTDSVIAAKIISGAVETAKLADGAVTAQKIADSAVQTGKIGQWAVDTSKIRPTGNEGQVLTQKNGAAVWDAPSGGSSAGETNTYTSSKTFTDDVRISGGWLALPIGSTITTHGNSLSVSTGTTGTAADPANFFLANNGAVSVNSGGYLSQISTTVMSAASFNNSVLFSVFRSSFTGDNEIGRARSYYLLNEQSSNINFLTLGQFNQLSVAGPRIRVDVGSGTWATPSPFNAVANNSRLFTLEVRASSGTAMNIVSEQRHLSDGPWVTDGTGLLRLSYPTVQTFLTTSQGAVSATEKMRLTSSGTLAIGITSLPSALVGGLYAVGTSTAGIFQGYTYDIGANSQHGQIMLGGTDATSTRISNNASNAITEITQMQDSTSASVKLCTQGADTADKKCQIKVDNNAGSSRVYLNEGSTELYYCSGGTNDAVVCRGNSAGSGPCACSGGTLTNLRISVP